MLPPVSDGLTVRSAIPGRIRWEAPAVLRNAGLAEEIRSTLAADLRVRAVEASPLTGTILVLYDQGGDAEGVARDLAALVLDLVLRAVAESGWKPARIAAEERLNDLAVAAVLVSVPAAILAVTSASPLLVGTSLAALAGSVAHFVATLQERGDSGGDGGRATLARVMRQLEPYRWQLAAAAASGFLAVSFGLIRFAMAGMAIEIVIPSGSMTVPIAGARFQIIALGVASIGVSGLLGVCEYAGQRMWRGIAAEVQQHLRLLSYQTLQRSEMSLLEQTSPSELQSIVLEDVEQFKQLLSVAWDVFEQMTNIVLVMTAFFYISPNVAWMALFGVSATIYSTSSLQKRVVPRGRLLREAAARLAANTTTSPDGLATIKSFAAERTRLEAMRALSGEQVQQEREVNRIAAAYGPAIEMSVMGSLIAITVGGGLASGTEISVAAYSTMIMLTRQLLLPLLQLGRTLETFHQSLVSLERLFHFLDSAPLEHGGDVPLPPRTPRPTIAFRDVSFAYDPEDPVLRDVTIEATGGETTAIVGPTGSGKSTLLRLLLRFRDPAGQLTFDGIPVRSLRLRDLRESLGVVSQEVYLFPETLRANIALARPAASLAEIREAARIAGADDFIMRLPRGYDTMAGERGVRLSGGERQRIAIARALLADAPVLIFDEATSHLDNETEQALYDRLTEVVHNRTMIVVAHRLAAARRANRIYVLDEGKVRESGTHDDLVRRGGLYATLWKLQTNGG